MADEMIVQEISQEIEDMNKLFSQQSNDDLKPCPFCGAIMNLSKDGELISWHDSGCFFILLEDEEEVNLTDEQVKKLFVKAWNRRVNDGRFNQQTGGQTS